MRIDFPEHEEELESIGTFLDRHTFPDLGKLKKFLAQLTKIDSSIDQAIKKKELCIASYLENQKSLVTKLAGRCHHLEVRRDVISLAEAAETLANSSPERSNEEIAHDANLLRDRIDLFVKQNRPSRNNAKFIRFAKACIDKAEKHEPVVVKAKSGKPKNSVSLDSFREKEATPESLELAELLYELARLLYTEKYDEFEANLLKDFSPNQQKEIHFHVSACKGNLRDLTNQTSRLKTIQGILGYAHDTADYYMDNTPYPTIIEVHNIFQDLDFVTHLENEEK